MSNRAQRRAEKKKQPKWQKLTKDQKINALLKNGITPQDLEKSFNDGYERGRMDGIDGTYKICFAAACLALSDTNGFGAKRCHMVMEKMQEYIVDSLTSQEAVFAVFERMGLTLDFGDPQWFGWTEDD